jgi:hypothetical protein
MSFVIQADFGTGLEDISQFCSGGIKRTQKLHRNLKPSIDTCEITIYDETTANKFNTTDADIPVTITKDGSAFFKGIVRPTYKNVVRSSLKSFTCEVTDKGILLQKKIDESFEYAGYTLSDPTSESTSLLHQLFYKAGFSSSEVDFSAISKTIDYFVVERMEKKAYDKEIQKLLWEYGYVYYFDASGVAKLYNMFPTSISATTITNTDIYDELSYTRKEHKYEAVRVRYYPHVTKNDIIVFSDTSGGDSDNKCNIEIVADDWYPEGVEDNDVYSKYRVEEYEIITVNNATLDWSHEDDVTQNTFTPSFKRALVKFYSSSGGTITKFDIRGDAVLRDKNRINDVIQYVVADSDKIQDVEAEYIDNKTDADVLANGLADYIRYTNFTYETVGEGFSIGDFHTLQESVMSINTKVRVVEIIENEWGDQKITLEGMDEYSVTSTTAESEYNAPLQPPEEQKETTPTQYLTYDDDQSGYTAAGGTTTPTAPTMEANGYYRSITLKWDKQYSLTNYDHYEVQVSDDQSNWYSLKFDGSDWKDALGAVTTVYQEYIIHSQIPLAGTTDNPSDRTLYYRVRRVTTEPVQSSWSTTVSASTHHVNQGDIAADAISAAKIQADVLNAMIAEISSYIEVSSEGIVGQEDTWRSLITAMKIALQKEVAGSWVDRIVLGGDPTSQHPDFLKGQGLSKIGADLSSLDIGDSAPANSNRYDFEGNYEDEDGTDPWDTKSNTEFTNSSLYGQQALKGSAADGYIEDADAQGIALDTDFTLAGWNYVDSLPGARKELLKLTALKFSQKGNSLNLGSSSSRSAITNLNSSKIAYINEEEKELKTYSWDGTDWSQTGNGLTISDFGYGDITALDGATVAMATIKSGTDELRTYSWDGTDWSQTGNGLSIEMFGGQILATLDSSTIALIEQINEELRTYSWDGTDWSQEGNGLSVSGCGYPSITQRNSTSIYFLDESNEELRIYHWDGTDWSQGLTKKAISADKMSITTLDEKTIVYANGAQFSDNYMKTYTILYILLYIDSSNNLVLEWDGANADKTSSYALGSAGWFYWSIHFDTSADTLQLVANDQAQTAQDVSADTALTHGFSLKLLFAEAAYRLDDLLIMPSTLLSTSDSIAHYNSGYAWAAQDIETDLFLVAKSGGRINFLQQPKFPDGDVANTERVQTEHIFTADNELDYTSDIADSTTVTISELPSNTVALYAWVSVAASGEDVFLRTKRNSSASNLFLAPRGAWNDRGTNRIAIKVWIETDGNSFYCYTVRGNLSDFKIIGYKTKG